MGGGLHIHVYVFIHGIYARVRVCLCVFVFAQHARPRIGTNTFLKRGRGGGVHKVAFASRALGMGSDKECFQIKKGRDFFPSFFLLMSAGPAGFTQQRGVEAHEMLLLLPTHPFSFPKT